MPSLGHYKWSAASALVHRLWVTALTLSAALAVSQSSPAAFEFKDDSWEGNQELYAIARSVAGPEKVKLVAQIDYGVLTPADALLIVHPMALLDEAALSAFIQAGGRVAVLDDFGQAEPFLERFQIRRLPAPTNPIDCLRGNPNLPIAVPVENRALPETTGVHPIARDVDRLVLNHPAVLTNPGLTGVFELRRKNEPPQLVAITGVIGTDCPGRLFVMSDPSAVMNLMLRFPGNRNFARGLVRYLIQDDGRAGKGQLYLVANRFEQTGHFGRNDALFDARHAFTKLVRDLRNGIPSGMLVLLAAATVVGVTQWTYRHALRVSKPRIPRFLRAVPLAHQAGWPGRAAALMAKGTHPAFVVLELRAAFRERLIRLTTADENVSSLVLQQLVDQQRLLDSYRLERLGRYLAELDAVERALAERRAIRIRKSTLNRLLVQGIDLIDHISQVERRIL